MTAAILPLLLMLQSAASVPPPVPAPLGPQTMPKQGCAAFLWSVSERRLIAVANAQAGTLRIALGAKPADYARAGQAGVDGFGFAATTRYGSADVSITLAMTISTEAELTDGALVQQGTLTIERQGADAVLVPVAGIVGCAPSR